MTSLKSAQRGVPKVQQQMCKSCELHTIYAATIYQHPESKRGTQTLIEDWDGPEIITLGPCILKV